MVCAYDILSLPYTYIMKKAISSLLFLFIGISVFAQFGLKPPTLADDTGKCKSCVIAMQSIPITVTWDLTVKDNVVYFEISDGSYINKIFTDASDGIAVDLVTRNQYTCKGKSKIARSKLRRGHLLEPAYYLDFKAKIVKDEETGAASFPIVTIPDKFKEKDYELNFVLIKVNTVCYQNTSFERIGNRWELLQMGLHIDTTYTKISTVTTVKTIVKDYKKQLTFTIPFKKNKWEYSKADIKPLYDSLRLTDYQIRTIHIHAYASVEGTTENNLKLQEKRATTMIKALGEFQNEKIVNTVTTSENWVEFIEDMEKAKKSIGKLSRSAIKQKLNKEGQSKALERYLKRHRKAVVKMELTKRTKHEEKNSEVVIKQLHQTIIDKDVKAALAYQQEMFSRIAKNEIKASRLNEIEIPGDKAYASLHSNKFAFNYQQNGKIREALTGFEALYVNNPESLPLLYNICALKLISWYQGERLMKPRKLKVQILKLKKAKFNEELVYRLLLNFHIVRSQYAMEIRDYKMKDRSVNFLKGKYRRAYLDDEDMIRVAKYLAHYGRLDWADMITYPKAKLIQADIEIVFYYLGLTMLYPENSNAKKYRKVILNAITKDKKAFCKLFNYGTENSSFQALSSDYIKDYYCNECQD